VPLLLASGGAERPRVTGSGARGTQERAVALRHAEAEFCLADCLLHGADGYEAHPAPPPPPPPPPASSCAAPPRPRASFAPSERPERHAAEQPGALQTDRARAAELYARAACQRHVGALLSLGACRYHGLGVSRDPAGAFRAYQVATPRQGTRATWRMRGRAP